MADRSNVALNPEVEAVLSRLRRRIRRYVALEGLASLLVVLGLLFWGSLGVDWAYFQASKLELPRWFRAGFLIVALSLVGGGAVLWVVLRTLRSFRARALALVLERRFPQLNDRLITAVEAVEAAPRQATPLTAAMLGRTVDEVARVIPTLDLGSVFDSRPLRRALVGAAVLTISVLGFAVTNADAMNRWIAGYIALDEEYWQRETVLVVKVLAQPGDRIREFEDGVYRHPRGGDLTLLVETAEGKRTPERVRLDYRIAGGGGKRVYLTPVGDQPFQHTIAGLLDSVQLWVSGGDFTTPRPLYVEVVEPPAIEQLVLASRYPEYTGLNRRDADGNVLPTANVVQGTQISLPLETRFVLRAQTNKPLSRVLIQTDSYELELDPAAGCAPGEACGVKGDLTIATAEGAALRTLDFPANRGEFAADQKGFKITLVLSPDQSGLANQAELTADDWRLPLPPDALVRIYLEDLDGIAGTEPARLTINGIVDQPPIVETALKGIGTSITRKARIPVTGEISDDYGIVTAGFEYVVDAEQSWHPRAFAPPPAGPVKRFPLRRSDEEPYQRFDVFPLDLSIQQQLTLRVVAEDGDNLHGPHESHGQRFVFTIVPNEELLSILYARELNLRRRFEQIIRETKDLRQNLLLHRSKADELQRLRANGSASDDDAVRDIEVSLAATADRGLHSVRKNATETAAIEESFGDIRAEMVNNVVDTPQMLDRIDNKIVSPLNRINTIDYANVDATLGLFKLANEQGSDPAGPIDEALVEVELMLVHMEKVLLEMRKLETFQEALELLKAIIADQEKLHERTKSKSKKALIDALK